ncbi:hypothetical protein [Bradyrhizobium sp. Ai1a-2]|uniref:hypothetical protein n=1 Tax=Bradyrhizobium sp. Ai1a-2 TaxID=196490 RepID=UPI001FCB7D12|nr:hypothetical protein [Bradyrhizobium sp. Ai1a-2]
MSLAVPKHPTAATFLDCRVDQTVAGEAAPCLELGADGRIVADHGHEIALTAAAERSYQIRQKARSECLGAGVELNVHVHFHEQTRWSCRSSTWTAPVTISPEHNKQDQSPTKTSENQRSRSRTPIAVWRGFESCLTAIISIVESQRSDEFDQAHLVKHRCRLI